MYFIYVIYMTIDDKLDWSGYIEKVTTKVASSIAAIKRTSHLSCPSIDQALILL